VPAPAVLDVQGEVIVTAEPFCATIVMPAVDDEQADAAVAGGGPD